MLVNLEKAVSTVLSGGLVGLPTDTVYGVAALVGDSKSWEALYQLKGRSKEKPFLVLLASFSEMETMLTEIPPGLRSLAECYWPGALSIVLPVKSGCSALGEGVEEGSVGFRVPDHALCRDLLKETGPLWVSSANYSDNPAALDPFQVEGEFGLDFPVLDGGSAEEGMPSTLIAWKDGRWRLWRLGSISLESIERVLGPVFDETIVKVK